jgi:hypothetical protein
MPAGAAAAPGARAGGPAGSASAAAAVAAMADAPLADLLPMDLDFGEDEELAACLGLAA